MYIRFSTINRNLIFPFRPTPKGRSKNQFAPFRVRGKQIDFYFDIEHSGTIADMNNTQKLKTC